ncbi:glycosyltransferase family 9 protein [uncultured Microscilla sp.]|uniref:glycosyltransferase family 9 protein n=1 Tax=uncultured Microscilla sp. TaxID=432653 RepID=UPI00262B752A|nr:glycosyltransferase family 9 protein [uncultured Microscilla sp.]
MKKLPESIIISRTDNLGDVMLTLPMTGYIKSIAPTTKVYFLGKSYTRAVIESSKFVDQFIDKESVVQDSAILASLQAQAIVFAAPDKEVAKAAKQARIPLRIGTSHRWYHWLYCNQKVNFTRKQSELHEAQLNFKLFAPLGLLTKPTLEQIKQWYGLEPNQQTMPNNDVIQWLSPDKFNLIIHPKSKGSAKEWGLDNYTQLVKALPVNKFQVLITGIKAEGDLIKQQAPEIFKFPHVHDLTGKLSLSELVALTSKANGFLAGSTGPLHIASAVGIHTLGIYPPIRPMHPGRWQPVGKQAHYLGLDKKCNDCRKSNVCACVRAISVDQVKQTIEGFLNR